MHLLIIRPGALGDTLMLVPALAALHGKVRITVAGRRPGIAFIRIYAEACLDMEEAGWHRLFLETPHADGLSVRRPDVVVAFLKDESGSIRRNLRAYFPGARVLISPSLPPKEEPVHAALHVCHKLRSAGLPLDPEQALIQAAAKPLLGEAPTPSDKNLMVIHPGSGDPTKNHSLEMWMRLLEEIRHGGAFPHLDAVWLLGPAEASMRPLLERNRPSEQYAVVFCPEKDALKTLLRKAALYLGHDSGVTHLAAMLGAPTLALFRASDPRQWKPLGPRVTVLRDIHPLSRLVKRAAECSRALVFSPPLEDP